MGEETVEALGEPENHGFVIRDTTFFASSFELRTKVVVTHSRAKWCRDILKHTGLQLICEE